MSAHPSSLPSSGSLLLSAHSHPRFPGLNTLRFYAALAVIIEHVGVQFPAPQNLLKVIALFFLSAQHGVNLFFVLSGFFITYLLLDERMVTGTINIGNFYIRRVLRILPLYYWVTLLGLVIFPILFGSNYPLTNLPHSRLLLAFALLPNFASLSAPMIHLWSIGVEEQFYALWPWANRSDLTILKVCAGIIIIKLVLTPIIVSFHNQEAEILFYSLRFECMAIGALGAYLYSRKHPYLKWIYHWRVQTLAYVAFLYLVLFNVPINTYNTIWSSLVHIVLIMNVATNQQSILKLNFPLAEKLGEISYGLYLYHLPVLYVIYYAAYKTGWERLWTSPLLLLLITLASTGTIAFLSYHWFETPFLRLKNKLTVVPHRIEQSG